LDLWLCWLIFSCIMFVVEIFTAGFFMFWFGIGGLVALVLALLGLELHIQMIAMLIVTVLLLIFTKPLVNKAIKKVPPTNTDAYIGKKAIVIKEINNIEGTGTVKVMGETWSAISTNDSIIPAKTQVIVEKVTGAKLEVKLSE